MRLNKYISSCGICSRRDADKLISEGRVTVDGIVAVPGMSISDNEKVCLDGQELIPRAEHSYYAYYKPVGVVCTERDSHAKRTVIDELGLSERVTYAGRLDKDSEGLLLMTDDGELIQAIMKGSKLHEKEYEVELDRPVTSVFLSKMAGGVYLPELDKTTRPCKIKKTGDNSFNIILTQGLNRQIRRMCRELGANVKKLKRVRIMSIKLSDYALSPGKYVKLKYSDIDKLYADAGLEKGQGAKIK